MPRKRETVIWGGNHTRGNRTIGLLDRLADTRLMGMGSVMFEEEAQVSQYKVVTP